MNSYTTEPHSHIKRGNKTVRARCIEYIETLAIRGTKELPIDEAKAIFNQIIDEWDNRTENRYFGTQTGFSKRKIDRMARYQSGTMSMKTIELKQFIPHRRGYLERLGLIKIEKRGDKRALDVELILNRLIRKPKPLIFGETVEPTI